MSMTLAERIELHEEWLRSMESNHAQFAADMAVLDRRLDLLSQIVVTQGQNLNAVTIALASLTTRVDGLAASLESLTARVDDLAAEVKAGAEQHRKLEETVERYIRYRGNGRPEN